jgi:hypothetical protein
MIMKKTKLFIGSLVISSLVICSSVMGQEENIINSFPHDSITHKVTYQGVVQIPGINRNELYSRAKEWFAKNFKSVKDVLQMDDKEAGKLIGKGNFDIGDNCYYNFTLSIFIKDNKYKYIITDYTFNHPSIYGNAESVYDYPIESEKCAFKMRGKPLWNKLRLPIKEKSINTINSIKAAMNKPLPKGDNF